MKAHVAGSGDLRLKRREKRSQCRSAKNMQFFECPLEADCYVKMHNFRAEINMFTEWYKYLYAVYGATLISLDCFDAAGKFFCPFP